MGFAQGSPLPNVTETTTTAQSSPDYYKTQLQNLSAAGAGALTKAGADAAGKPTTVMKTGEDLVAGYDPMQTLGYNALPGAATSYQPGLSAAQQTANRAAAGITPGRIQSLMNPYTTNVVNEMSRLSQQNLERNLLPTMRSGFVGTGGLGSQRYANALGQSMSDIQSGLTGQQYGALSKGYSEALRGALDEAQLMNQAARTQGDLAKAEQELGLTGAGALTKAGAERQAYAQSILDAPMKTAKAVSDLMRGYTVPTTETKTFTGPRTRDYYQQSDMSKLLGGLTFARMAGQGLFGTAQGQAGLLSFLTGAAKNINLGGGRTVSFDDKGQPTFGGNWDPSSVENVSGDIASPVPTLDELKAMGININPDGTASVDASTYAEYDPFENSSYFNNSNDSDGWDWLSSGSDGN
jgi:hypothetical protein